MTPVERLAAAVGQSPVTHTTPGSTKKRRLSAGAVPIYDVAADALLPRARKSDGGGGKGGPGKERFCPVCVFPGTQQNVPMKGTCITFKNQPVGPAGSSLLQVVSHPLEATSRQHFV